MRRFYTLMSVGRKKLLYVKRMLPLFRAVVKFCSTNRLFKLLCERTSRNELAYLVFFEIRSLLKF